MKETTKTVAFVAAAVACLVLAWGSRSSPIRQNHPDQVGQSLFPDFQDPYAAKSMEIVSYDDSLDRIQPFEVAQEAGRWVIPSHDNYPADAEERLKNAATLLVDLPIIDVVGDRRDDHRLYGVMEPDKTATEGGEEGLGTVISFKGENNNRLAALVIGKQVKDRENQHYVRVPGQDLVYVVEIDPKQISTRFEDWIQQDLLEISGFDVAEMEIRDYSVEPTITSQGPRLQLDPRFELAVRWNDDDYRWDLQELREYQRNSYEPRVLRDDEDLNRNQLDAMKQAIDELKIVDVVRKPAGLRPSGSADKPIWQDMESLQSLQEHGFYPQPTPDEGLKLYCSDGEVDLRTKNGVEYTLRFGSQVASIDTAGDGQIDRYMMISAQVDPNAFEKPVLELPPEPSSTPVPTESEDRNGSDEQEDSDATTVTATESEAETETETATDEAAAATDTDAERDRLIKEYNRKLDEYHEKVKKAEAEARDLNMRLGDWYFVVSNDVYEKIRPRRNQVVQQKELASPEEGTGFEAFRALEASGLPD